MLPQLFNLVLRDLRIPTLIFRNLPICVVSTSHELQRILARSTEIIFLLFPAVALGILAPLPNFLFSFAFGK